MFFAIAAPAGAQNAADVPIAQGRKLSCAGTVNVQNIMDEADLAFTGRILARDTNDVWFRIYKVHVGKPSGNIIKASGFYANQDFYAGGGQSYEAGKVYTAVVSRPQSAEEKRLGVDYINVLDHCQESVISKIHDRYGLYRVEPAALEPTFMQKLGNSFYFNKSLYVGLALVIIVTAVGGGMRWRKKRIKA
ncbi:MAG: hypothetical protein H6869_09070 [Rhodospirillales bacterium]|nr:hypothetical protein [Rhodospirillales bacterium]